MVVILSHDRITTVVIFSRELFLILNHSPTLSPYIFYTYILYTFMLGTCFTASQNQPQ